MEKVMKVKADEERGTRWGKQSMVYLENNMKAMMENEKGPIWGCDKGHFTRGDHGYPTIMLEAVASYDSWIWHAYFGMASSNNDLNVLNASPLFDSLLTNTAPQVSYEIGDVDFDRGYYLADRIYPSWASFVKGFSSVVDAKRKYFTKKQFAARKDVERTFGILQGRWGILRQPARAYSENKIKRIMYGCIILHNMIIEDNGFNIAENKSYYLPVNNLQ
ncbi:uncharacterized protein [Rutidosis leptorrhynchoides]|uniref:uncharacterized protein n=1 Tax=Rutidosis leptorrhynchoides TaxID=125765 RepID=UPI003A98F268